MKTVRFAILGEDDSDAETLKILVRRVAENERLPVYTKGYNGCAQLMRKGARDVAALAEEGWHRFVIAHDADRMTAEARHAAVWARVVKRSQAMPGCCCVVVPVEELEAWILADVEAVTKEWPAWRPKPVASPERIESPKEHLERLSRDAQHRPRYSHKTHNPVIAPHLDLAMVERKCPSFCVLSRFVRENLGL
jgi:hypothetical protein